LKYPLIQALRGIAALWVVLFHIHASGHVHFIEPIFRVGNSGVAIFFALSGFVIAHSLRGDRITFNYLGRFALRRSIRLDPALWASIALCIGASMVRHHTAPSMGQFLSTITYSQVFLGYPAINDVYWTLTYEVQFYIVLVLCVMVAQRFGTIFYLIPFAAASLWGSGLLSCPTGMFLSLWHAFFLGVLSYHAIRSATWLVAFAALCLILIVSDPSLFTVVCMITATGLLIAGKTGIIDKSPGSALMGMGAISYSLYLIHNPVSGASYFVTDRLGLPELPALAVAVSACIGTAALFWYVIERPTMRLARMVPLCRPNRRSPEMLPHMV
jgi:peptidoglycan/LPS O-acetylase OafA/YrhL